LDSAWKRPRTFTFTSSSFKKPMKCWTLKFEVQHSMFNIQCSTVLSQLELCFICPQFSFFLLSRACCLHRTLAHPPASLLVSWMQSATSCKDEESQIPSRNMKITQVTYVTRPTGDPEKQGARATNSHDHIPRDQQWGQAPKVSRVPTHDKARETSRDQVRFGYAKTLLINKWQTVGTVNQSTNHHMTWR